MPTHVLIVDDHSDVQEALRILLKGEGYSTERADSPAAALAALTARRPDLVLMDLNFRADTTSGREGMELLARVQALDPLLPVVVMTGFGSIELAVEAMRRGARDFVQKPWHNARLLAIIRTQVELSAALRRSHRLEAENALLRGEGIPTLIAESPAMQAFLSLLHKVAPSDANVLITGENGTGKSLAARVLHASSNRADQPFLTLNAGGLAEGVLESELFGHVKGAFTDAKTARSGRFELADGGTLFLDEIANAPRALQARLLRVLETGEFERVGSSTTLKTDVRLLSATHSDLDAEVQAGRFRQDLRFRINTIELRLPPLRDRPEDVAPLARHFLARHAQRYRKPLPTLDEAAVRSLEGHAWPGNVRELDHAIERAVLLATGSLIRPGDLMLGPPAPPSAPSELSLEEAEGLCIRKALARHGNATAAAAALGLSRSAMYRKLQKLGIGR
ncbi:sigma-54-dependent transcriptional regulator [Geothrix alkalitolerans]|uniref:sigma-54-dependent transcriptional regulator n=1 Tax=Geothrix alkalitolerans TaxID=2922724 RepID=UPI001FAEF4A5|nr:sigma-54 dependent transcriptional regulator [Geothrix alkalitolerans]